MKKTAKGIVISFRTAPGVKQQLQHLAEKYDRPVSWVINRFIRKGLQEESTSEAA